jgi:predicted phosphate transport protein (TIGR00153 family)
MKALLALFGKSPFKPLQAHMEKVRACVEHLNRMFSAMLSGDEATRKKLVDDICRLESEADAIKNDIRAHLPRSMFLPVDRRDLLEILTLQDFMADTCQDIALTLTLRETSFHPELKEPFTDLLKEVTRTCFHAADITQELDELLETGFGGKEAENVLAMIEQLNTDETIADGAGLALARKLFSLEKELTPVDVMLWYQVFRQLGELANLAEGIGNRLRLLLAR